MWRTLDSQVQILALAFRLKSLNSCKVCPFARKRSRAVCRGSERVKRLRLSGRGGFWGGFRGRRYCCKVFPFHWAVRRIRGRSARPARRRAPSRYTPHLTTYTLHPTPQTLQRHLTHAENPPPSDHHRSLGIELL